CQLLQQQREVTAQRQFAPVAPLEGYRRIHRQQANLRVHVLAGRGEQLTEDPRVIQQGWPGVEVKALTLDAVSTPADTLVGLQQRHAEAAPTQMDGRAEPTEPSPHDQRAASVCL